MVHPRHLNEGTNQNAALQSRDQCDVEQMNGQYRPQEGKFITYRAQWGICSQFITYHTAGDMFTNLVAVVSKKENS